MTHAMLLDPMLARLALARTIRDALTAGLADAIALNGAEMGNIQMIDPRGDLLIVAHTNTSAAFLRRFGRLPAARGTVCGRAAQTRAVVHVPDVAEDPEFAPMVEFARSVPFVSVLSAALITSRDVVVGVLSVHSRHRFNPSPLELGAMRDYATRLADRLAEQEGDLGVAAQALATQVQPELACACAALPGKA